MPRRDHQPDHPARAITVAAVAGAAAAALAILCTASWELRTPPHTPAAASSAAHPVQRTIPGTPKTAEPAAASVTTPPAPPHPAPPVAAPIVDSPEARHICTEVQASHLTPDEYRRYIQSQPSYAWMTDDDKANFTAGLHLATTGSCT